MREKQLGRNRERERERKRKRKRKIEIWEERYYEKKMNICRGRYTQRKR